VFKRKARGLLDFLASMLCLWVAAYQTPAGQLVRGAAAWATGRQAEVRPLLSYYSAGVYAGQPLGPGNLPPPPGLQAGPLPPEEAMGYGVWAVVQQLPPGERVSLLERASAQGVAADRLLDAATGPRAWARLFTGLSTDLGSPEAAVATLFLGDEPIKYALERAKAEQRPLDLVHLQAQLPPKWTEPLRHASQAIVAGTAYSLAWPVPEGTKVTSPFGGRIDPITHTQHTHTGVDLSVESGTPVHATGAGVVRRASEDEINGKVVIIDHGRGVTTAYCHNSELLVKAGDVITAGQVISHSGTTGRSTGPHVHYQLQFGPTPVDPLAYHVVGGAHGAGASD
jgi:murein DD-endopeptidase MepM/ murein hydrolase activator NlpD